MTHLIRPFSLSASALAASLFLAACGGGSSSPPADTLAPTLTITDNVAGATATGPVTFTFTFSEDIGASFVSDDIAVTGGTKGAFVMGSDGKSATQVVTPTANMASTMNVTVAVGKFTDLAGNANAVSASAGQAYDTVVIVVDPGNTGTCTTTATVNCIGFEAAAVSLNNFGQALSGEVANDPVSATNKVAKLVKKPASPTWDGATVSVTAMGNTVPVFNLASSKLVTMRVYSPAVGKPIMLKIENSVNGGINMEASATTTKANAWETLSFNFATPSGGNPFNAAATYDRVSIFPNFGNVPAADETYYFDELKYDTVAAGGGGGGGGGGAGTALVAGKFASNYSATATAWKSSENGDAGTYIDTSVPTQYWWNGVASADTVPSFYFGYGTRITAKPWGFGAFVKAPNNGNANVSGYANVRLAVWGNDELTRRSPTFTVILKGPAVGACTPELKGSLAVSAIGAQTYNLALNTFTLQTACGFATPALALAAGVAEVHVQVLGANLQYVASGNADGDYPNGLNIGPITFN